MNRLIVWFVSLLAALVFGTTPVLAQGDFPSKPVVLVVPFPPGGPTDALARKIAEGLREHWGRPVIVENKAGAGGNIGAEYVARAEPDGYTVLFGTSGPLAINVSLYKRIGYHPLKDFAPVIKIGYLPNVLSVNPGVPARSVAELIAYAKATPGQLSFASSGNGASSHLAGVLFNKMAGTELVHVPYKGTGPALIDVLGGQVSMSFTDVLTALPYIQNGRLRALGVTTQTRSRALPDVPTLAEQGLAGYDVSVFFGIVVPAKTPEGVVERLNRAFREVLQRPAVKETFAAQGLEPAPPEPEYLGRFMRAEVAKWAEIVKESGAQID